MPKIWKELRHMDIIRRLINKRYKVQTTARFSETDHQKVPTLFAVQSGIKSGAIDITPLSLDNLSHSKGTLDETLNSKLFL